MKITKSFTPSNLADWRNWLAQNHDREQEVWLVYLKAARDKTNILRARNDMNLLVFLIRNLL